MKCQWKECDNAAAMIERFESKPLIALCFPHEWEFMKRIGEKVSEAERVAGWGKFCAERGYDPTAATFEAAVNQGTEEGR